MSIVFGIDLGTTNSVIAKLENGQLSPIPLQGSPIVPSVVLYQDNRVAVGREARNLELQHPELTIRSVKRKMGQDFTYQVAGKQLTPEQVSADILRALKRGAEAATGHTVSDVVITVPAYFNDAQRRATLSAGELAGLNVLRLLNEPTSASLVYDQVTGKDTGEAEIVLIYDLGGGTFDVSVMEVFSGVREVRATAGNTHLGGDDFDELLMRLFLDELKRVERVDPREDLRAMARLRRLAEDTKIRLSSETELRVREEFLTQVDGQAVHLDLTLTRRRFEDLIGDLVRSTIDLARRAVEDAHLSGQRISRVCLVGGSTRIPLVRRLLESAFEAEVHEEVDPDLAVGLGAAIQAGLLLGVPVERILVDVTAHSLGIRAMGGINDMDANTFAPVLRRNTALPASRTEEFYTVIDNQQMLQLEAFQGESPLASQNTPVGSFEFPLAPRPANSPLRVQFSYDLNGVVRVSVAQVGADNEKTVAFNLADTARMLPEPGALTEGSSAPHGMNTAIERKARELLEKLSGPRKDQLSALFLAYQGASLATGEQAEEALLDFFLRAEDEED